ncbi:Uncharacterised protein [Vibrio cholerae]|uniref:Uncharacterized protein n=1 Tax=Vibrio cholerae TaxID=666 RepID=A0A656AA62_VIBCL|nr:Uncharacterised protein [Vibrio cholerae]CSB47246.1 Uncharacterised protein [Vibrio cholerae]CSC83850.1 Uncharacterised protein [Vibrio cholerae]CSC98901.1 Uncharacterised protein [Vibrio cholerae]
MHGPDQKRALIDRILLMNGKSTGMDVLVKIQKILVKGVKPFDAMCGIFKHHIRMIDFNQPM